MLLGIRDNQTDTGVIIAPSGTASLPLGPLIPGTHPPGPVYIVRHDPIGSMHHNMSIANTSVQLWPNYTSGVSTDITNFISNLTTDASEEDDEDHYNGYPFYNKPWPLFKQSLTMTIILSIAYITVLLMGVANNALVVSVIYRNPQMRTVTNYFIANLAVADILVSIFLLPITLLSNLFTEWWYGSFVCKVIPFLQGVSVGASVNTLAAVAIERYLAIFYPQTTKMSSKAACIMIGIIWVVPMCIFIPWIVVYIQKVYVIQGYTYVICTADWKSMENRKMYTLGAVFLTCYLIPLIFIAIFYLMIGIRVYRRKVHGIRGSRAERNINRSKTRILRMLIVVFVMFALSWLPLYCIELRALFGELPVGAEKDLLRKYLMPIAQWLGASNSCVNPFIYCYFSTNFRSSIVQVIRSRSCCGKITT